MSAFWAGLSFPFLFGIGVGSIVTLHGILYTAGYSVLEGQKLLSNEDYTVVTGAPRDESKGSVMFGEHSGDEIQITHTILGEQVGSYFGNSLAATDLNNDE